jgi:peptidoglycan/xylan/chitin deacetylase (PgdA/CDA1 family)
MSYLARNAYHCLSLPEAVGYLQKGERLPNKSFVLTFDDGYQDFHSNAVPILAKFGFTATVFLVAGCLGSQSNWWGQEGAQSGLLLSLDEARSLVQGGHILGSHSLSHPFLNKLDDRSALEEIRESRIMLQNQLDMQVDFFSYPFSETNTRIERLVESVGYTAACAGDSGSWSLFHLWRIPCMRDDTRLTFLLKVSGWYNQRTALRESTPGRFLRRIVRNSRYLLNNHHPHQRTVLSQNPDKDLRGDHD